MSPLPVDLGEGVVLRHYEMGDLDALWDAIERHRAHLEEGGGLAERRRLFYRGQ